MGPSPLPSPSPMPSIQPSPAQPSSPPPASPAHRVEQPPSAQQALTSPPPSSPTQCIREHSACTNGGSCCAGTQCFRKNRFYSQFLTACPTGRQWECQQSSSPPPVPPSPVPVPVASPSCSPSRLRMPPTLPPPPDDSTCVVQWAQCGGNGWDTACCGGLVCVRQSQWYAQCREASLSPQSPNRMSLSSSTSPASTNSAALRERDVGEEDDSVSVSTSLLTALIAALVLIPAVVMTLFCAWRKGCRRAAVREGAQHDKERGVPSSGGVVHVTPPGLVSG